MRTMLSRFLTVSVLFACLAPLSGYAATCTPSSFTVSGAVFGYSAFGQGISAGAACSDYASKISLSAGSTFTGSAAGLVCTVTNSGGSSQTRTVGGETSCTPPASVCEVGQGRTFNRTEGWARTSNPDANDLVVDHGPPAIYDYNDGVCVGNIIALERCFRSQEPSAQGLYRTSCDYTMVNTGESSSPGDAAASPSTAIASCPGFVGEVNGKTVCVGTASSPLPSSGAPNEPTVSGNPSAGVKPSTGEGSGSTGPTRTPTAGSGGNTGGPASASVGPSGTGVRAPAGSDGEDGEDATAVCGAPPLPSCNVKVDETGTPDGSTFGTSAAFDGALDGRDGGLATARDSAGDTGWGIVPAWTQDQACAPWDVFTLPEAIGGQVVTVDLCPLMPLAEGILNFIWAMLGIFAVTSMVSSAMTGKGT